VRAGLTRLKRWAGRQLDAVMNVAVVGWAVARLLALHSAEREATASRVANLFPPPETTEWGVREIAYDRTRRSRATPQAS